MSDESLLATAVVKFTGQDAGYAAMREAILVDATRTTRVIEAEMAAAKMAVAELNKQAGTDLKFTVEELGQIGQGIGDAARAAKAATPAVDEHGKAHQRLGTEMRHSIRLFRELTGNIVGQFAPGLQRGAMEVAGMGRSLGTMGVAMAAPLVAFQVGTQIIGHFIEKAEEFEKVERAVNAAIADMDVSGANAQLKELSNTIREQQSNVQTIAREWDTVQHALGSIVAYWKNVFGPSTQELVEKAEAVVKAFEKVTLPKQQAETTKAYLELVTAELERLLKASTYTGQFDMILERLNGVAESESALAKQKIQDDNLATKNQLDNVLRVAQTKSAAAQAELADLQKIDRAGLELRGPQAVADFERNLHAKEKAAEHAAETVKELSNAVGQNEANVLNRMAQEDEKYTQKKIANAEKVATALMTSAKDISSRVAQQISDESKLSVARDQAAQKMVDINQKMRDSQLAAAQAEARFNGLVLDDLEQYQTKRSAALVEGAALERKILDESAEADLRAQDVKVEKYQEALDKIKAMDFADLATKKISVEKATDALQHEISVRSGMAQKYEADSRALSATTATKQIEDARKVTEELRARFAERIANAEKEAAYLVATGRAARDIELNVQAEILASDLSSLQQKRDAEVKALALSKQLAQERLAFAVSMGQATVAEELAFNLRIVDSARATEQERQAAAVKVADTIMKSYNDAYEDIRAVGKVSLQDELAFAQASAAAWASGSQKRIDADRKVAETHKRLYDDMAKQGEGLFQATVRLLEQEGKQNIKLADVQKRADEEVRNSKKTVDDFYAGLIAWSPKVERALNWQKQFGDLEKQGVSASDAIDASFRKLTEGFQTGVKDIVSSMTGLGDKIRGLTDSLSKLGSTSATATGEVALNAREMAASLQTGTTALAAATSSTKVYDAATDQLGDSLNDTARDASAFTTMVDRSIQSNWLAGKFSAEYEKILGATDSFYSSLVSKIDAGNARVADAIYNVFYTRIKQELDAEAASS